MDWLEGEQPSPEADLLVIRASELPSLLESTPLERFSPEIKLNPALAWSSILPLYRENLLLWQTEIRALPLVGDAPFLFYRKDLLRDSTHRAAFAKRFQRELQPPATWQEYLEIAEYFHETLRQPSLPPLPQHDRQLETLFYTVAASLARRASREDESSQQGNLEDDLFSFHFDQRTGQPRIAKPGFVAALQLLQKMNRFRPESTSADPLQTFVEGRAVFALGQCRDVHRFQQAKSAVIDRVGVVAQPGSAVYFSFASGASQSMPPGQTNWVPYTGTDARLLVVREGARFKQAALSLAEELASRRVHDQLVCEPSWGGAVQRQSQLDRMQWDSLQLEPEVVRDLRAGLMRTLQPNIRNPLHPLRLPGEQAFSQALCAELRKVLASPSSQNGEEAKLALGQVNKAWQELIRKDPQRHLRQYRQSLGLSADR